MIEKLFPTVSKLFYILAAAILTLLSLVLTGMSAWRVIEAAIGGSGFIMQILDGIGLIVVAIAVFDVAKFIIEEEVVRDRELRSASEARISLTKFATIIVIVVSLEGLVMIFEAKEQGLPYLIYPAAVVATAILGLIGLGLFQWLSRHAEEAPRSEAAKAEEERIDRRRSSRKTARE